ncbi:MAG: hypothetical protein E6G22_11965 [Actinobacteria bacterium]|nr:MAG: hypothetical protein E6G22_11965 [Actinomycetota bacterium]
MAQLLQVIAQKGPLPIKTAVKIETDAPTVVTLAGSVWSPNQDQQIGIVLSIDGNPVQDTWIFANPSATHLAVVPVTFPYTFTWTQDQEHVFELDYLTKSTTSDFNDLFVVTVQY